MLIQFKGVQPIYEHEYKCVIKGDEFNNTLNPSILVSEQDINERYIDPEFSPYITTIGLYNNSGQLLAVAKVSQPIKKLKNSDMTLVVRLDITN